MPDPDYNCLVTHHDPCGGLGCGDCGQRGYLTGTPLECAVVDTMRANDIDLDHIDIDVPSMVQAVIEAARPHILREAVGPNGGIVQHTGGWILIDPDIRGGEPVIYGTRIPAWEVAALVEDGVSPQEIGEFYPSVTANAAWHAAAWYRSVRGVSDA